MNFRRVWIFLRRNGPAYALRRAEEVFRDRVLRLYDRRTRLTDASGDALAMQRAHPPQAGLISVAIPVYNTRPEFLTALADALLAQTYPHFEAIFLDGGSSLAQTHQALDALRLRDSRLRILKSGVNLGIASNTNAAIAAAQGDYIALCDHDDTLAPDALWQVARVIQASRPALIYSDEDKLTEDGSVRTDPHPKPDFCPDNLRSGNYLCHLTVIRRDILDQVGGLRPDFDGSQDHDLVLRVSEVTRDIAHIPRILYHWRSVGNSMSHQHLQKCLDASARAVEEHMGRIGFPGTCRVEKGVLRLRYDVAPLRVELLTVPRLDPFTAMNRLAREANGDVLLFVMEGVTPPTPTEQKELLMYAQRPDVGAVTPQILNRRGRVVHAGYAITQDGAVVSRNRGLPRHAGGWHGLNRVSHEVSAVSPLCFMIRRAAFIPFDEAQTGLEGMVAWCLALRKRGLRLVYTPHASVTAGVSPFLRKGRVSVSADWHDPCVGAGQLPDRYFTYDSYQHATFLSFHEDKEAIFP